MIPELARQMWAAFSAGDAGDHDKRFYEAFAFGDSSSMADELGQLVLAGIKRATAGSVWSYEASGKGVPKPGDFSIVTDSSGAPLCIIETVQVDIVPFKAVSEEFAAIEGEGDGSLVYWRQVHLDFFTRECERSGRIFSDDMAVACERFRVVFPPAVRDAV